MATTSAPGKVYLFGEHAVVYGEPAVPCAIDRRVTTTVTQRVDTRIIVEAPALDYPRVTVEGDTVDPPAAKQAVKYVLTALKRVTAVADAVEVGFDVEIESALPIGAGLGSSAAVTVATIDAAAREVGLALADELIADHAYEVERTVQGDASRADTFCSVMGGAVRVEGADCQRIPTPDLPLVVGYDGGSGNTGELVAGVRALQEDYRFAADTVAAIGDLVRTGEQVLVDGDLDELGRLMNVNHGLLSALGVSGRSLDTMVWTAREAGALGAKLTGAGGAGCIVALDPSSASETALASLSECEQAFAAPIATEGMNPQ